MHVLKEYWGFTAFRDLQEQIIASALAGKDTLALMPTGGGKSLCYQIPALCRPGICIVISPLIALMKDQVQGLQEKNISAAAIYSGMHYKEIDRILDNCVYGHIKLLYVSPERLQTEIFQERVVKMNVNLLAVDEAHCISQWGYDFRPAYLNIAEIRNVLPGVSVLALTATATERVVDDIQERLSFKNKFVLQKSFFRSNLSYSVLEEEGKLVKLNHIFSKIKGSGLVYVRNRRKTKEIAQFLQQRGQKAYFYHAGLSSDQRSHIQEQWMNNTYRIIVCTNAFGMGIDKPDVRVVVHMDLPESLEAYFQEAGRAGRDGQKAYAVLLYNNGDKARLEKQFLGSFPEIEVIKQVYRALGSYFQLAVGGGEGLGFDFDVGEFSQHFKFDPVQVYSCLKVLEQAGWIILNEAVFVPSCLKISVDKDVLYDYQLKHPRQDRLLKAFLRAYQGAFQQPVHFKEQLLAQSLKMPLVELKQSLERLQNDGIVEYFPQKEKPQLVFAKERMDASNLTIDQHLLNFRKAQYLFRMEQAIQYAEKSECRSRQLLNYFGEKTAKDCGICDVCLNRKEETLTTEVFDSLKQKIRMILRKDPLELEEILDSFSPKWKERLLKVMEYLLDEGFVEKEGMKYYWHDKE